MKRLKKKWNISGQIDSREWKNLANFVFFKSALNFLYRILDIAGQGSKISLVFYTIFSMLSDRRTPHSGSRKDLSSPGNDDWYDEILNKNPISEMARQSSYERDEYFLNTCPTVFAGTGNFSLVFRFFLFFLLPGRRKSSSWRKSKPDSSTVGPFRRICSFQFPILPCA